MNILRMLNALLRGLRPHPPEAHIRGLQVLFAKEAALQSGRADWDGGVVTRAQLRETIVVWRRK